VTRPAPIRSAVFPVAGRGTRFLPATKASPKEMLPVVDKPLIQYAVEEALAAGARNLVFITGASKRAIEDHFDSDPGTREAARVAQGKSELLASAAQRAAVLCLLHLHPPARAAGPGPRGAVRASAVGNEPFFVHLADDLIDAEVPCLKQMAAVYEREGGSVVGVRGSARPRDRQVRHRRGRPRRKAPARVEHRREAEAGRRAVEPGRGRPLPAEPKIFEHLEHIGRAPAARSS
jgi:UTP--glucose-1-phosphate uridylyltransferase